MLAKLQFSLRQSVWLFALLFITSALPARAQSEFYDEFYDDLDYQEGLFKFEYSNDLKGYIISPNKYGGPNWDQEFQLYVPSIYLGDGNPVVALSGFDSLKELREIFFPEDCHVKYICDNCFKYCNMLGSEDQELNLPESVETIGHYSFYGCTNLRSINLSSNLISIGVSAFELCKSLESITLPKSLKVIREYAFRNCALIDSQSNCIGGLKSVVFEDGVDFWTNNVYCFYNNVFWGCANLSEVTLPKDTPGDFIIPMGTFGYCSNLKSIEFPKNTRKIEQIAFYRSGLEILDLTKIELDEDKPFYLTGYYTFAACENLTTITAKGKVQFDGLYTFQECTALETVTFTGSGEDYTVMNPDIFKRCYNLQTVKFYRLKGNGQDNDMDSVFTDCKSLVSVTSECTPEISKIGYSCFDGCTSLTTLSLPQTEFSINETAFRGCTALEEFDFTNVTSIGKATFKGCTALTKTQGISNVSTIGENAFEGCTGLTSLDFADLTSIGPNAFNGCTALASVNFNSTSETPITFSIGSQAFTGCTALKSLNFKTSSYNPPTVESEDAFDATHYAETLVDVPENKYRDFAGNAIWKKFTGLKRPAMYIYTYNEAAGGYSIRKGDYALEEDFTDIVEIPATYNSADVVAIEEKAFGFLPYLSGVILPEGLTSIGADAFSSCDLLTAVINKRTVPLTEDACPSSAFYSYDGVTLTVPFGSLEAYKNTGPWSNFSTIEQGFGERTLSSPESSRAEGVFNYPFALTLTNSQESGTIYYYIVGEGDVSTDVHTVNAYTTPITIDSTCKVVAYISDEYCCSESATFEYTYVAPEPEPSKIVDIQNIPQGTKDVDFTTLGENETLDNVVIDNIYYSITDIKSGYNQYGGLVLNKMSSVDDIRQFNRDIQENQETVTNFNGIAVKVKGTGSITFNAYANYGKARLTILLGDGEPVDANDLTGMKYEFSTPKAQYLYIFALQSEAETETLSSLPSLQPAENSVIIVSLKIDIADEYVATENGLDKVLTASADESYRINTTLYGHYFYGTYLYASTMGNSGSSKNTFNEDKKSEPGSDNESNFNQEDWVAISGLTSDYVGQEIESGNAANVVSNTSFPVITFPEGVNSAKESCMNINDFRVAHFNIQADNAEVKNIWLVAPQPAEYCSFTGYMSTENINTDEHYFVLQSAEKGASYLTTNVYYDPATLDLSTDGWHCFKGIVSKEGDALKFTALSEADDIPTGIENVDAGSTRIFAANGNINVASDEQTVITVYSANGQLITSLEASNATIAVTPGFYIVKVGNYVTKLAVK
ncbi:MAG: leucine-rich repeat protein [Muribaculaceae bacterium]